MTNGIYCFHFHLAQQGKPQTKENKVTPCFYTLLSTVEHLPETLLADHTKSVKKVFRDAAHYLMRHKQVFNVLSAVDYDGEEAVSTEDDWPLIYFPYGLGWVG